MPGRAPMVEYTCSSSCAARNTVYCGAHTVSGRALMVEYAWLSSTVPPAGITMPLFGAADRILQSERHGFTVLRVFPMRHEHIALTRGDAPRRQAVQVKSAAAAPGLACP